MPRRNRNARRRAHRTGRLGHVARTRSTPARRCPSGKVRFADKHAADAALKHGANKRAATGKATGITKAEVPVRAYECPQCGGGWHLTSQPR